jgi:hypothetical protein
MKLAAKQERRMASKPIIGAYEYKDEQFDNILNIRDDLPLENIIEKLSKNSE